MRQPVQDNQPRTASNRYPGEVALDSFDSTLPPDVRAELLERTSRRRDNSKLTSDRRRSLSRLTRSRRREVVSRFARSAASLALFLAFPAVVIVVTVGIFAELSRQAGSPLSRSPIVATPAAQTSITAPPAAQTPAAQTPAAQTPAAQTPAVQTPVVQPAIVQAPAQPQIYREWVPQNGGGYILVYADCTPARSNFFQHDPAPRALPAAPRAELVSMPVRRATLVQN